MPTLLPPGTLIYHLGIMVCITLGLSGCHSRIDSGRLGLNDRGSFQFGLWGDMPYTRNNDVPKLAALIKDMNAADLAFTVYNGDTKDGSSRCDDETIGAGAAKLLNQTRAPTVYVPGDNEWTDCHRLSNGGYDALERLQYIRANLFGSGRSFGQTTMPLEQQGPPGKPYSENTRWIHKGVVFVGLNVPGSNNNRIHPEHCVSPKTSARKRQQCDDDINEYEERNRRNIEWLAESFQLATKTGAVGVMVIIHGDPGFDLPETEYLDERTLPEFDGYSEFLAALEEQARAYNGQVVLVHGDSHFFKVDKPLHSQSQLLKNFTRVETFGSPNIHWLRVTVDPRSRNIFVIEPMIVPGN